MGDDFFIYFFSPAVPMYFRLVDVSTFICSDDPPPTLPPNHPRRDTKKKNSSKNDQKADGC